MASRRRAGSAQEGPRRADAAGDTATTCLLQRGLSEDDHHGAERALLVSVRGARAPLRRAARAAAAVRSRAAFSRHRRERNSGDDRPARDPPLTVLNAKENKHEI